MVFPLWLPLEKTCALIDITLRCDTGGQCSVEFVTLLVLSGCCSKWKDISQSSNNKARCTLQLRLLSDVVCILEKERLGVFVCLNDIPTPVIHMIYALLCKTRLFRPTWLISKKIEKSVASVDIVLQKEVEIFLYKVKATLKSAWTEKDQINNLLKESRLMRSLEKFVGGKLFEEDLRLHQKNHMIRSYDVLIIQVKPRI
ncbi:hypothetical protein Tco_1218324 [Tanacetum coccineum]